MSTEGGRKGSLYLIPATLGEGSVKVIPEYVKASVAQLREFIVENEKSARRYLRSIGYKEDFDQVTLHSLGKHTNPEEIYHYLDNAEKGVNIGLISEAGAPGVADPGAEIVLLAHRKKIKVIPLVGPSSILLALMASGLNGQNFAFHGYLPIDSKERGRALKQLEVRSLQESQTQIFMEAPYRNNKLLDDILKNCHEETLLCVAANITLPNEFIKTDNINNWKKSKPDLHKKPCIFLIARH